MRIFILRKDVIDESLDGNGWIQDRKLSSADSSFDKGLIGDPGTKGDLWASAVCLPKSAMGAPMRGVHGTYFWSITSFASDLDLAKPVHVFLLESNLDRHPRARPDCSRQVDLCVSA